MDFSELKKIFNIKRLFEKPSDSVLGVDIGSSAIKIVQLRREKGSAVLETYGELSLGPYAGVEIGRATSMTVEKTVEALTDLLREAKVTTTSSGFSIPFASSLLTIIKLPKVSQSELNTMVPLEARKYIPAPISEVMLDWFVIPSEKEKEEDKKEKNTDRDGGKKNNKKQFLGKKTDVLLVAIHNEVLNGYNDIVGKAALDNSFFEIEIFSSMRAVLGQSLTPVMIVDIGAATTKVYVVEYGVVRISHVINKGSQDVTIGISKSLNISAERAEEVKRVQGLTKEHDVQNVNKIALLTLDYIFSEVNRVLLNYQMKNNKNVPKVILTGGGSVMKGMLDLAKKHLETDVVLGDPFSKIDTPAFLDDVLKEAGPEFTVAVGIALRKLNEG